MKSISLGQYYPAKSPLHSLDGRIKIICAVLFMVGAFLCKSFASFAALLVFTLMLIAVSSIPLKIIMKSIRMILFILLFTFIVNMFFTPGEKAIFTWWIFSLYPEGIWSAGFMAVRILCLVSGTGLLISYTATPIDITHSLESLLSPLKKIGVPVHSFAMMMFIALRFIPTLSEDTDKIITAQKSRGADFESGSVFRRIKALIPILVPLFVSSFRRADELAVAMECRCYHGGDGRTSMKVYKLRPSDFVILAVFVGFCAAFVLLNRVDFLYTL